jgi:glycosyltransferase involved in cell wall biosynthesis
MKIIHVGDICGIPQTLAIEQRRRGHQADCIDFPGAFTLRWRIRKFTKLLQYVPAYDRVHFHYSTALPFALDLPIWKILGKEIVMHFHGSDIRCKRLNPIIKHLADKIYVSTPDLLQWAPCAEWQPQPFDFSSLPIEPGDQRD